MEKTISVVLATYNRAHIVQEAIASVFAQTHPLIELIVSDDCSTDATSSVCETLMRDESRIVYVKTPSNTGGCIPNLAHGLLHATGEYVVFLADDDVFLDETFFATAIQTLESNEQLSFVFTQYCIEDGDTTQIRDAKMPSCFDAHAFVAQWPRIQYDLNLATFVFRRDFLIHANVFDNLFPKAPTNDYTVMLKAALHADKIGYLNLVSHQWRKTHEKSHSRGDFSDLAQECERYLAFPLNMHALENLSSQNTLKNLLNHYVMYAFDTIVANYISEAFDEVCNHVLRQCQNQQSDCEIYIYGKGEFGLKLKAFLDQHAVVVTSFVDDHKEDKETICLETFHEKARAHSLVIVSTMKPRFALQISLKLHQLRPDIQILSLAALSPNLNATS